MKTLSPLVLSLVLACGDNADPTIPGDAPDDVRDRFYRANFEDLMGSAMAVLAA